MKAIITAAEAARILGVSPKTVRTRILRGQWGFGRAFPPVKGRVQWTFEIYTEQLNKYLKGE